MTLTGPRTVRAWSAVHISTPGLVVLLVSAVAALTLRHSITQSIGPIALPVPAVTTLFVPTLAGVGAALPADNQAALPLPDPARAIRARLAWTVGWLVLACASVGICLLFGANVHAAALFRNVLIAYSLSLLVVTGGAAPFAWLPPTALALASILFGGTSNRPDAPYTWWASILNGDATGRQWTVVGLITLVSVAAQALGRRRWQRLIEGLLAPWRARLPSAIGD